MANIASSKKDARRSAVRATRNRSLKSSVKTSITKVRRGLTEGTEDVGELATGAISSLDRAVSKGVLHRNNAARRKARLAKRLNEAAVEKPAAQAPTKRAPAQAAAKPAAKSGSSRSGAKTATKTSARKKS